MCIFYRYKYVSYNLFTKVKILFHLCGETYSPPWDDYLVYTCMLFMPLFIRLLFVKFTPLASYLSYQYVIL